MDEICRNTGQDRKYVIRKLSGLGAGNPRSRRRRTPTYGRDVQRALEALRAIFDYTCVQKLGPLIRTKLEMLRRLGEISVSPTTAIQLMRVSPAKIDRLLPPEKGASKTGRRYGQGSFGLIAKRIGLRMGEWQNVCLGQMDMELVFYCGSTTAGEYGPILDVFSGKWEEGVAIGQAQIRFFNVLKRIESRTSFHWRSIHSDNDKAFINAMVYQYTKEKNLLFSRSQPYRKNDTLMKNFTHFRRPLGYLRHDTPAEK